MKKSLKMGSSLLGLLVFILAISILIVPAVQARELAPKDGPFLPETETEEAAAIQDYNSADYTLSWGASPDMLIDCDPNGNLLAQVSPGRAQTYHSLQASACKTQAAQEAQAARFNFGSGAGGSCGYSAVSGESRMMKITGFTTEKRIVYLRCGKKVGVLEPATCSCGGSWRYTYTCNKPPTVYVTIPCH